MEGLLPPVEMGLYMWESKSNDINTLPIINSLKAFEMADGAVWSYPVLCQNSALLK